MHKSNMSISSVFEKLGLKLGNELLFKCNLEKTRILRFDIWNMLEYMETLEHNKENKKSALSLFRPNMETEYSTTQATTCFWYFSVYSLFG
jgi:hypothetical protein